MVIKRYADECKSWEGWGSFVVEERDCKEMLWGGMVQRQGGQQKMPACTVAHEAVVAQYGLPLFL
jgi:hypothetical protein